MPGKSKTLLRRQHTRVHRLWQSRFVAKDDKRQPICGSQDRSIFPADTSSPNFRTRATYIPTIFYNNWIVPYDIPNYALPTMAHNSRISFSKLHATSLNWSISKLQHTTLRCMGSRQIQLEASLENKPLVRWSSKWLEYLHAVAHLRVQYPGQPLDRNNTVQLSDMETSA